MQPMQKPLTFFIALLMSSVPAEAVLDENGARSIFDEQLAINDAALGEMRGGFTTTSGLQISFGIERVLYVNGELISTTSLNVVNLTGVAAVAPVAADVVASMPKADDLMPPVLSASQTNSGASAASPTTATSESAANSTSPSVQISPASNPATNGGSVSATNGGSVALIQSGAGNTVSSGAFSAASIGTVVQNTLNNQRIQNVTVISATVNSMEILKTLNLQLAIGSAINDSVRK